MPGNLHIPDLFTPAELTEAINKLPLMPQRLRPLFAQRSVRTTKVALDIRHGRLVLVSNQDRSAPPQEMQGRGSKNSTYNAPANWIETANTYGNEFYARMDERTRGRGYDLEVQANPLAICTYPEALVKITASYGEVVEK